MATGGSIKQQGSKLKKKHFKPKYQKTKVFRANEPLLSVFMWGINHTIVEQTHVNIPVMLMPEDFKAFSKVKVDNHHFNKENLPSHFKVKEYCPLVFRNLRDRFGIDEGEYMNSLSKSQPVVVESPGRSGAHFYQSFDKMFIIKTLLSEEVEQMHVYLKQYHPYIVERHGKTLLPQYLGMYRLTVDGVETYLVVMRNVFSSPLSIHKKYDLKGSTVDRETRDKDRGKDVVTLKDNDFVKDGKVVHIGPEAKEKIMNILSYDIEFLCKLNVMDYSLLLGVHNCEKAEQERAEAMEADGSGGENGGPLPTDEDEDSAGSGLVAVVPTPPDSPQTAVPPVVEPFDPDRDIYAINSCEGAPKKEVYFMALVDVLTHYGMRKRTAQAAKTVKHGSGAEISTVHPEQYARRLMDFISKIIQ
ncbi:phosphatidylinositol 5-phosphate 4-kinase type-2 alpha-like isoform X1 [Limulus polyphemus]|uniref:Phosphatidylinositol 5-phosphate 4-kinase type-2 alpha-like isoform X1 n=1 Tax=Limulus polyphemus TaxID=6850 RepID=A0ABM1B2E6_LIMPO|nr:phosphatidylinositol 5-phosphate 4-kinase type-2 alpha-like isoform X1 [Limulus polyphemus]